MSERPSPPRSGDAGRMLVFYAVGAMRDTAQIRKRSAELQTATGQPLWLSETARAFLSLGRGDTTQALAALARATDAQEIWPSHVPVLDPAFDSVSDTDRFRPLLRRVGLAHLTGPSTGRPPSR